MTNNSEGSEDLESLGVYNPILPHQTTVYFTVLSIIQAIAFGFLLLKCTDLTEEFSWITLIRAILVFAIIVIVWHRYATESQFLWPLTWMDTLIPFFIGGISFFYVFSVDFKVSISSLLACIVAIELAAIFAYHNAWKQRKRKKVQRIYMLAFQEMPEIGKHLISALVSFDCQSMVWFAIFAGYSMVLWVSSIVYYQRWYEILFPIFLLAFLIAGEIRIRIYKTLAEDPVLKPYFE